MSIVPSSLIHFSNCVLKSAACVRGICELNVTTNYENKFEVIQIDQILVKKNYIFVKNFCNKNPFLSVRNFRLWLVTTWNTHTIVVLVVDSSRGCWNF